MKRVKLAITMGDPAGVGSEIIVKALNHPAVYETCIPVVIGDVVALEDAVRFCHLELQIRKISKMEEALGAYGTIECISLELLEKGSWQYKQNSALCGDASFQYVTYAIQLAKDNEADAIVTAPISKESINMAGYPYTGHTEILAEYTGTKDFAMLLASKDLHVIHVSTHVSLMEACRRVRKGRVLKVIRLAERGMRELGYAHPKIAVAGLNPHCSENGLFGTEEEAEIIPAIEEAKCEGIHVEGPIPPDTVFVKCAAGKYDIVVAMYHDQGHIPLKLNGFEFDKENAGFSSIHGINCTIGLPIVRTSVDHGTAFGKAGEGRAKEDSMVDAIEAAVKMVENRNLEKK